MVDREHFEDNDTVESYLDAIPRPDTAYRDRLRARLASQSVAPRRRLPRFRLRWTGPASVGLAVALALAFLLAPFAPQQGTPLNPKAVLAAAVKATSNFVPYSGTAQTTFMMVPESAPAKTMGDLGRHEIVSRWVVRDATHWRIDTDVRLPALQSEHQVAVANGTSALGYRQLTHRAVRYPLPSRDMGSVLFSMFQGGWGMPLAQSLQHYLQALNNPRTHTHAKAVGRETVLGRAVDVIEVWPVLRITPSCSTPAQCARKQVGYGRARLWIDHQYGVVLRYQQSGLPANNAQVAHNLVYRVTSISFGIRPSRAQLAYTPPVQPVAQAGPGLTSGGGESQMSGAGATWRVPAGFIPLGSPADGRGERYALYGNWHSGDNVSGITSVDALYLQHAAPPGPNPVLQGPFLYVQEQHRATGLPVQFTDGMHSAAGRCATYTGTYPDGLHWIALARHGVSLLAVSDRLSKTQLVRWAATEVCR